MGNNQDNSETKSLIVLIAGVALLGLLTAFVVKRALDVARQQALTAESQVIIQGFSAAVIQYRNSYGEFPLVPWGEMTRLLQGENLRDQNPSNVVFLAPSRKDTVSGWAADSWGTPLSFTIRSNVVRVWSSGPNKKDEKGFGDDVLVEHHVPNTNVPAELNFRPPFKSPSPAPK